jgi:hypothetical protein
MHFGGVVMTRPDDTTRFKRELQAKGLTVFDPSRDTNVKAEIRGMKRDWRDRKRAKGKGASK